MELKVSITRKGGVFDGKTEEVIREELLGAMYEATMFLERKVKSGTPQGVYGAKGGLLSTIHGEVIDRGVGIIRGIVGHQSAYGDVIEKGRTAGKAMPPEGSLIRWIQVKLGMSETEAKGIEYVIRRKIALRGFEGAQMFQKAFEEGMPTLTNIFDKRGFNIARRLN
jgi:hypothetical protein